MITPQRIAAQYRNVEPYLEPLRSQLRQTIQAFSDPKGFAISSRVKTLESVAEKIETGRYARWSDLDDLVAFTVVIPTLSYEEEVLAFLAKAFEPADVRRRGATKKPPDVFRFDSTRFIGKVRPLDGEYSGASQFEDLRFEVQIRSAFEHAWAVTTHALTYKGSDVKWKKLRLTAQLKAAVEQLDQTVLAFEEASLRIEESEWPDTRARENITNSFRLFVADGRVPEELAPKDWSRFVDNIFRLISGSKWSNRKQPDEIAAAIVGSVETECDFLGKGNVPVSISLWQFVFGSLCKSNILEPPLRKCWPVITPELELLYPAVKQFAERFDYSR